MQVKISANTIRQVVNADVINIDQVRKMSPKEQNDIIVELIQNLKTQVCSLKKEPKEICSSSISKLADYVDNSVEDIAAKSKDKQSKKNKVDRILKNIKSYLGSTSDILLNVVKIAQILGVQ